MLQNATFQLILCQFVALNEAPQAKSNLTLLSIKKRELK